MTHTEHMYHDRLASRNGTQISRASTIVTGSGRTHNQIGGRRVTQQPWEEEDRMNIQKFGGGHTGRQLLQHRDHQKGLEKLQESPNREDDYPLNHLNSGVPLHHQDSLEEALTVGM